MSEPNIEHPPLVSRDSSRPYGCPTLREMQIAGCPFVNKPGQPWRELFPNSGYLKSLPDFNHCYTVATDGDHLLVWRRDGRWLEVILSNFDGPISLYNQSPSMKGPSAEQLEKLEKRLTNNGTAEDIKVKKTPEQLEAERKQRAAKLLADIDALCG